MHTVDFLIIGAGVVGLTTALALRARLPEAKITVLEKEERAGFHASGRNSGVLHAGFYYSADSLKARFSVEGNRRMKAWCAEHDLPVRGCGKLVVARDESEHAGLDELLRRAEVNGVDLQPLTEAEAREIEPRVRTAGRALWSPTTAAVDAGRIMEKLADFAIDQGIVLRTGEPYVERIGGTRIRTSRASIEAGFLVNAAGLYADRIARDFGLSEAYRILPFKGLYLYGNEAAGSLSTHIYPVPDLEMPFLGVHFTVTPHGGIKIGPTALPAFWRENYEGLQRFSLSELLEVLAREARLFLTDPGFRKLAVHELSKASRHKLVALASDLLDGVSPDHYPTWGRPGIRAQLFDLRSRALVTDFVVERSKRTLHVLNAVSPAFTCSLPFADHLADQITGVSSAA